MGIKDNFFIIPYAAFAGISEFVEFPRRLKLRVDYEWEERRERERKEFEEKYGSFDNLDKVSVPVHEAPKIKQIHLNYWESHYKKWSPCSIAIDIEKEEIAWDYTSSWLFNKEHKGSGMIGIILISLPFILLLYPILFPIKKAYEFMEKRRGLSRHSNALLKALKGQLKPEDEKLLIRAMENSWQKELKFRLKFRRQVNFAEAQELLKNCSLTESFKPREVMSSFDGGKPINDPEARSFYWFDDKGDNVARGSFYGQRDHYVNVLGSTFEGDEADVLVGLYMSRTLHDMTEMMLKLGKEIKK